MAPIYWSFGTISVNDQSDAGFLNQKPVTVWWCHKTLNRSLSGFTWASALSLCERVCVRHRDRYCHHWYTALVQIQRISHSKLLPGTRWLKHLIPVSQQSRNRQIWGERERECVCFTTTWIIVISYLCAFVCVSSRSSQSLQSYRRISPVYRRVYSNAKPSLIIHFSDANNFLVFSQTLNRQLYLKQKTGLNWLLFQMFTPIAVYVYIYVYLYICVRFTFHIDVTNTTCLHVCLQYTEF